MYYQKRRRANAITINYNVTSTERKRLAETIKEVLGCKKKYIGMPNAAYRIDYIEVSKCGTVTFDDCADSEEIKNLPETLEQNGFHAGPAAVRGKENEAIEEMLRRFL